ncbi:MAG TPA: rhomboid family intramembrane serine protease [Terriglobales bacterium]|jgi:membrane associated rhomboid family serine protease|nr:rhomboid family intramembrane serine protease [Terriglobales bacterium]
MLLPIKHENMSARRLPVVTLALIAINVLVFLGTYSTIEEQAPQLGKARAHILLLAAAHPELKLTPEAEQLVTSFEKDHPSTWKKIQDPSHDVVDPWDAKMRLQQDPEVLQEEMDSLAQQYVTFSAASLTQQYAFVPAHPRALTYLTANFLHGGWLHLIGNMWFLWLAGFVLEDVWGRPLYTVFYLVAGAAALQFHAWTNPGSLVPTLGASGAVAALMGAFLVRFPKMKIRMAWLFAFRIIRFNAPAYTLLPLWLLLEVFYGAAFGGSSGVAHWAHVGGFAFGAIAAVALRYSGLEQKANQAVESKVSWTADPAIDQAHELIEQGQFDAAGELLKQHLAAQADSVDAAILLCDVYRKKNDASAFQQATAQLCALHLKLREPEAAWQDYEEFLNAGGTQLPANTRMELGRALEEQQNFERALSEYLSLAENCASERAGLMAQLAAARLCLKRLNRPQDALQLFQAAAASPVPHLDLEVNVQAGIKEAQTALSGGPAKAKAAGAGA